MIKNLSNKTDPIVLLKIKEIITLISRNVPINLV